MVSGPPAVVSSNFHKSRTCSTKYERKKKRAKMTWDKAKMIRDALGCKKEIVPKSGLIHLDFFFFLWITSQEVENSRVGSVSPYCHGSWPLSLQLRCLSPPATTAGSHPKLPSSVVEGGRRWACSSCSSVSRFFSLTFFFNLSYLSGPADVHLCFTGRIVSHSWLPGRWRKWISDIFQGLSWKVESVLRVEGGS